MFRICARFWPVSGRSSYCYCALLTQHSSSRGVGATAAESCSGLVGDVPASYAIDFVVSDAEPAIWILRHREFSIACYDNLDLDRLILIHNLFSH